MAAAVTGLGYLGIRASDLDGWRHYAGDVLGLECLDAPKSGAVLARMDDAPWRITIEEGNADDIAYAGFEVSSPDALEELRGRLKEMGVDVEVGSSRFCDARAVEAVLRCEDPDGVGIELFCGRTPATEPFTSPRDLTFVTGDQGLGHLVLLVADAAASRRFYEDGLGFRISDFITLNDRARPVELTFLHCNPRHHTLALAPVPKAPKRLDHFMLQVDALDAVGATLDLIEDKELPLSLGLGRHTNDHMVSFYAQTPSGFDVEFGCNGRIVDDATWTVERYESGSLWGHRPRG